MSLLVTHPIKTADGYGELLPRSSADPANNGGNVKTALDSIFNNIAEFNNKLSNKADAGSPERISMSNILSTKYAASSSAFYTINDFGMVSIDFLLVSNSNIASGDVIFTMPIGLRPRTHTPCYVMINTVEDGLLGWGTILLLATSGQAKLYFTGGALTGGRRIYGSIMYYPS